MAAPKGRPKPEGSGRSKGTENQNTKELKDMIRNALDKAGGESYLLKQSKDNPVAFMNLVAKILPKDINHGGQDGNPIKIAEIKLVPLK